MEDEDVMRWAAQFHIGDKWQCREQCFHTIITAILSPRNIIAQIYTAVDGDSYARDISYRFTTTAPKAIRREGYNGQDRYDMVMLLWSSKK